jgi:hypothetical protein
LVIYDISLLVPFKLSFYDFLLFLVINILALTLLDAKERRVCRKVMYDAISKFRISYKFWLWFVRSIGGIVLVLSAILAVLFILQEKPPVPILAVFMIGIYCFWYLNYLLDNIPPIDKRIMNVYKKKYNRQ